MTRFVWLAAVILLALGHPASAYAADPVEAKIVSVDNKFPNELLFTAQASSTAGDIRILSLRLSVGNGEVERYGNFEFTPGRQVTGTYSMKVAGNNFVPAGADIRYWVDVQDSAGNKIETEPQSYWYADTRFEWSKLQEGQVTIYYYGGVDQNARTVMGAARAAQQKSGALLGVDAHPFKVMLYNRVPDIVGAQQVEQSEIRRQELLRVGVAYGAEDLVQVLGAGSGTGVIDTARHEITHLFVHWAAGVNVPAWLNEGLAVWGQTDPGREYTSALNQAIRDNKLLLLRGLDSYPGKSDENILAYGQGYSVVKFMIDTYGPDKFRQLFQTIKAGDGATQGLQKIYGLTIDELDAKWRASVGAPPRSYESGIPTAIAIPTIAPLNSAPPPQPTGQGASQPDSGAAPVGVIVVTAVGLLIVVGGAIVVAITRRRSGTA